MLRTSRSLSPTYRVYARRSPPIRYGRRYTPPSPSLTAICSADLCPRCLRSTSSCRAGFQGRLPICGWLRRFPSFAACSLGTRRSQNAWRLMLRRRSPLTSYEREVGRFRRRSGRRAAWTSSHRSWLTLCGRRPSRWSRQHGSLLGLSLVLPRSVSHPSPPCR